MKYGIGRLTFVLPGRYIHEVFIITQGLSFRGLIFLSKVASAGFIAVKGIFGEQLS
jgi:hypothetical protein